MQKKNNNTCIAVCTLNSAKHLDEVLESCLINIDSDNLIVVDGKSKDETVSIAKKYTKNIFFDKGTGLAAARNIALEKCNSEYIFYVGPDNIIGGSLVDYLIEEMNGNNWVGVSSTSFYEIPRNYFEECFNLLKKAKFFPGEKKIIGTPWLYRSELLKKMQWTNKNKYSDDSDLCQRLEKTGYRVGISKEKSFEIGSLSWRELKNRWNMYGSSDYEFYMFNTKEFTFLRKIRSFFNAFFVDFLNPISSSKIGISKKIYLLPFLFLISVVRFSKFLSLLLKG